jgi:antitoxin component of MazEF toxin-antitoxin module
MKLAPNGELTIPADVSRQAGFAPGVEVDVQIENGSLRITPVDVAALRFRRMQEGLRELGDIPQPLKTSDEVMALTRGED